MIFKAKVVGLRNTFYETEVIKSFTRDHKGYHVHMGHNKLMPMLIISDSETGYPVYKVSLKPKQELTDEQIDAIIDEFKRVR